MKKRVAKKQRKIDLVSAAAVSAILVVFDIEATCWESERPERQEILEIGAVRLTDLQPADASENEGNLDRSAAPCSGDADGSGLSVFSEIVRPEIEPIVSDFCIELTSIRQDQADAADPFPEVIARFLEWIGNGKFWLGAWGSFDRRMFEVDMARHRLAMPASFQGYIDLRREFARWKAMTPLSLKRSLQIAGLEMEGTPHRALDDARNLARLTRTLLAARAARRSLHPVSRVASTAKAVRR